MKKQNNNIKKKKAIVLFSGGLDSRLVLELLKQQGINILALHFSLPFGSGCCKTECSFKFTQLKGIPLQIIDCTKGKNFYEYMKIIKKPKHGYGSAINPCIDCKIFMLKKAKQLMKKEKADFIVQGNKNSRHAENPEIFIATGEVLNERPMSQHFRALQLVENESGLKGKLLRPLSAKLLPETDAEKKGIVDRNKLLAISGRSRKQQIAFAKKFNIDYPSPAGGCLLCEKEFAKKLFDLFQHKKRIEERDILLLKIGRHFRLDNAKIIVGRNESENKMLLELKKDFFVFEARDFPSPITLLEGKEKKENKQAIKIAAMLTVYYSDAPKNKKVDVNYGKEKIDKCMNVLAMGKEEVEKLRI